MILSCFFSERKSKITQHSGFLKISFWPSLTTLVWTVNVYFQVLFTGKGIKKENPIKKNPLDICWFKIATSRRYCCFRSILGWSHFLVSLAIFLIHKMLQWSYEEMYKAWETQCQMLDITSQTKWFDQGKLKMQLWAIFHLISKH